MLILLIRFFFGFRRLHSPSPDRLLREGFGRGCVAPGFTPSEEGGVGWCEPLATLG